MMAHPEWPRTVRPTRVIEPRCTRDGELCYTRDEPGWRCGTARCGACMSDEQLREAIKAYPVQDDEQ